MITARELRGCYPAIITPMIPSGGNTVIDHEAYKGLINEFVDAGVAGIVIAGTTGQNASLTTSEHLQLVAEGAAHARARAAAMGRPIQVIASAGSNSTQHAVELSRHILLETDVDGLLHVTGYYNNPPQEGLYRHFMAVADLAAEFHSSIILYNVPGRTKSNLEARTTVKLSRHPAIIGIKEASGDLIQVAEIIRSTNPEEFVVVSGEDDQVAPIIKLGGTGVISASANRWPREFVALCSLALAGEHEKAANLQAALKPCVEATFCAKNPIPLHHMLGSSLRLPLVSIMELEEPARSKCIETITRAEAITCFPWVHEAESLRLQRPA